MARQEPTVGDFLALLGDFPSPAPPDPQVREVQEMDDHTRALLEYTGMSDEPIQAFLLLPRRRTGKAPGILAIHQDGAHRPYEFGKSEPAGAAGDPELAYGLELCRRGYVVLCPDRFPYESRSLFTSPYWDTFRTFRIRMDDGLELTEDLYRMAVGNALLADGRSRHGQELLGLRRALDLLCARPEVDGARIGAIGHSAGGFYTPLLMYLDPRVRVGCASCGNGPGGRELFAGASTACAR